MPGGCDEVEEDMDTIVAEARITLDARLLCQDVIVLSLEVTDDLGEAEVAVSIQHLNINCNCLAYLASLSIWSPKPGVSTMVRDMRVPSSSNSNSTRRSSDIVVECRAL